MSTQTKHTPGPWAIGNTHFVPGFSPDGMDWIIAIRNTETGFACIAQGSTKEKAEANARLIAAAPDLLEACIDAAKFIMQGHGDQIAIWDTLNSAIAKAEGGAS